MSGLRTERKHPITAGMRHGTPQASNGVRRHSLLKCRHHRLHGAGQNGHRPNAGLVALSEVTCLWSQHLLLYRHAPKANKSGYSRNSFTSVAPLIIRRDICSAELPSVMALLTPYSQSFPGLVAAENPETSAFGYHDLTLKEWITRSTDST